MEISQYLIEIENIYIKNLPGHSSRIAASVHWSPIQNFGMQYNVSMHAHPSEAVKIHSIYSDSVLKYKKIEK